MIDPYLTTPALLRGEEGNMCGGFWNRRSIAKLLRSVENVARSRWSDKQPDNRRLNANADNQLRGCHGGNHQRHPFIRRRRGRRSDRVFLAWQGQWRQSGDNCRDNRFSSTHCRPYTYRAGEVAERLKAAVC